MRGLLTGVNFAALRSLSTDYVHCRTSQRSGCYERSKGWRCWIGNSWNKKKFLNHSRATHAGSTSSVQSSPGRNDTPGGFLHTETLGETYQVAEHDGHGSYISHERQDISGLDINMETIDDSIHPINRPQSPIMSQNSSDGAVQHEPEQNDPIGDMYHDLTFDLVHFNVTGSTTPQSDLDLPTDAGRIDQFSSRSKPGPSSGNYPDMPLYGITDATFSPARSNHTHIADPNDIP